MFRAYDADRERLVAVKLFKLDLPPDRVHKLVAAFEELIAAELSHRSILTPIATGISDVWAFLAYEYVSGESLDRAVREYGPAPPSDSLRVATQLASAVDFAAAVNIHHGSIHPRDILLASDQSRLTGVGVARALESIGVTPPLRRPYVPPERLAGREWGRAADVFGVAALIHELLWGRRIAGTGAHVAEALTDIAGADLDELKDIFARALAEDPNDRYATALEFVESLKETLDLRAPAEPVVDVPALDLLPAEARRFDDVEPAPAVAPPDVRIASEPPDVRIAPDPPPPMPVPDAPPVISVIEQSRSAVWPLIAAIALGLAVGFAAGYGVGSHDRPNEPPVATASAVPAPAAVATPPPAGREATEVAVTQPPKPSAPAPVATTHAAPPAPVKEVRQKADVPAARTTARTRRPVERTSTAPTTGRFAGGLRVESRPAGARVFLDGRLIGTTPLMVTTVSAGEHAVRLERDGYRRWSSSVRIVASEQNRVTASLER